MSNNNQKELKIIEQIKNNIIVLTTVISLFIILTSTKTTEIKSKTNNIKALDQEENTYRLVTSADNVQVPVPKGYATSQITGENYVTPEYQHTTVTHKISSTPTELTWSSPAGETYPWTQDENGIWISGNQGIPDSKSTLESQEFNYIKGTTLTINYTYSCQNLSNTDYLTIDLINLTNNITTRIVYEYGNTSASFDYTTSNYTYTMNDWVTGRYKIRAIYSKNASIDGGQDSGYIKPSTYFKEDENGTEVFEDDIKTKIHDGGFVIYQLTDEEIETDPNGTSVVINDTNKDEAQSTRNQYVWVPVENVEDIVKTKTENNGVMQFGQVYNYSNTSITKETSTWSDYFREPRLVEQFDKTKYRLQGNTDMKKRYDFLNSMQEEYSRMLESVNKYKGFYIGRYETGDDYSHSMGQGYFTNPKVVRYNGNIVYVSWYDSYKKLERLSGKTEKYVETGMMYNSIFDYILKWLNETDTRSYIDIYADSATWGYFNNNIITPEPNGTIAENTGSIETITYKGETYSDSPTASNNIFDIAGNAEEWTRARFSDNSRRIRGGYFSNSSKRFSASSNKFLAYYYGSMNDLGARSMLIIR